MEVLGLYLPNGLVYDIFKYIPKFNVTPHILHKNRLYNKLSQTIKKSINLCEDETREILKNLRNFDFLNSDCFTFENTNFYLTLYYDDPTEIDYVILFY